MLRYSEKAKCWRHSRQLRVSTANLGAARAYRKAGACLEIELRVGQVSQSGDPAPQQPLQIRSGLIIEELTAAQLPFTSLDMLGCSRPCRLKLTHWTLGHKGCQHAAEGSAHPFASVEVDVGGGR